MNTQESLDEKCLFLSSSAFVPSSSHLISFLCFLWRCFLKTCPQSWWASLELLSSLPCCISPSPLHRPQHLGTPIKFKELAYLKGKTLKGENAIRKLMILSFSSFPPLPPPQLLVVTEKPVAALIPARQIQLAKVVQKRALRWAMGCAVLYLYVHVQCVSSAQ